ncbi:hypothetical protein [Nocardia sp. NBC_01329]|uniref:hypothetical protein n=1 Tax=Nocardia sp. NBC_01329 TaxID=2903594 RepID=UPI002E116B3A|nr:hypothetical protein OG405_14610 [Nocardia sp. NBC_01329]
MTGTADRAPALPIVVGVDGSEASALAVRWASETAALPRCGAGFHCLLAGSTSNIVVQRAHCPVLVAHAT